MEMLQIGEEAFEEVVSRSIRWRVRNRAHVDGGRLGW